MKVSGEVTLERATRDAEPLLSNLLELYIHDMSEFLPLEPGPDGRFGYPRLALYWSEPETRFAFLIKSGAGVVGFTLVTRGSPASADLRALDVAEFFVLRRHRRSDVGQRAAFALWEAIPGTWVVRVSEGNRAGLPFWSKIIREYTGGKFAERTLPETPHARRIFTFESASRRSGG